MNVTHLLKRTCLWTCFRLGWTCELTVIYHNCVIIWTVYNWLSSTLVSNTPCQIYVIYFYLTSSLPEIWNLQRFHLWVEQNYQTLMTKWKITIHCNNKSRDCYFVLDCYYMGIHNVWIYFVFTFIVWFLLSFLGILPHKLVFTFIIWFLFSFLNL